MEAPKCHLLATEEGRLGCCLEWGLAGQSLPPSLLGGGAPERCREGSPAQSVVAGTFFETNEKEKPQRSYQSPGPI